MILYLDSEIWTVILVILPSLRYAAISPRQPSPTTACWSLAAAPAGSFLKDAGAVKPKDSTDLRDFLWASGMGAQVL